MHVQRPQPTDGILDAHIGGEPLRLAIRPGFADWGRVSPAEELIAGHARLQPNQRVLVWPCGHGALGVWCARRVGETMVSLFDTHCVAAEVARLTCEANGFAGVSVAIDLPARHTAEYDTCLMVLPKGRELARLCLLQSWKVLREGGRLYLAGPNEAGIRAVIADAAALFGSAELLGYKAGNRVVALTRTGARDHDVPLQFQTPGMADGTFEEWQTDLGSEPCHVLTRPGVFSRHGLDAGTRMLLEVLQVRASDRVLDVGCGYGIIGLFASKRAHQGRVTLVDADILACECARATLRANGLHDATVVLGDGLSAVPGETFTLIVTNPPFHTGHQVYLGVAEAFVRQAYRALEPRGRLVLVANRFLPYERLMVQVFGGVQVLARTAQYHVLSCEKPLRPRERGKVPRHKRAPADEETIYQIPDRW